jgi:hypothetical protein
MIVNTLILMHLVMGFVSVMLSEFFSLVVWCFYVLKEKYAELAKKIH